MMLKKIMVPNIEIKVEGANIENLINILSYKRIKIKSLKKIDSNQIIFQTLKINESKIIDLLKNSCYTFKVKQTINEKYLFNSIFKNIGFIISFCIFVLMLSIYSQFIWNIKIVGNDSINETLVLSCLEECGVKMGTKINAIDKNSVEEKVLRQIEEFSQIDLSFSGSTLIVNVKEKLNNDVLQRNFNPIVSSFDGIIKRLSLNSGTSNVKIGDYVSKGQILIEPYCLDSTGEKVVCKASAEIEIESYLTNSICYDEKGQSLIRTGRHYTHYNIAIFGLEIKTKSKIIYKYFESETSNNMLTNYLIPIKTERTIYYEMDFENNKKTFSETKDDLIKQCEQKMCYNGSGEFLDKIINVTKINETTYLIQITIKILERITN